MASFMRLKETVGRIRAFLSGSVALPVAALPALPQRAFADLVIFVHQQRAFIASLQATAPASLLDLIQSGFNVDSAELAEVQWRLENDFDVYAIREALTVQRCWELYTSHVDKLRRIEVTLSDALQKEAQAAQRVRAEASAALFAAAKVLLEGAARTRGWALSLQLERRPPPARAALLALVPCRAASYPRAAACLTGSSLAAPRRRRRPRCSAGGVRAPPRTSPPNAKGRATPPATRRRCAPAGRARARAPPPSALRSGAKPSPAIRPGQGRSAGAGGGGRRGRLADIRR